MAASVCLFSFRQTTSKHQTTRANAPAVTAAQTATWRHQQQQQQQQQGMAPMEGRTLQQQLQQQ